MALVWKWRQIGERAGHFSLGIGTRTATLGRAGPGFDTSLGPAVLRILVLILVLVLALI